MKYRPLTVKNRRLPIHSAMVAALVLLRPSLADEPKPKLQLQDVFAVEYASNPRVAPDTQRIVYQRVSMDVMKDRRKRSLWIINADGSGHRKLTLRAGSESNPAWSPDGTRLAYTASTDGGTEIHVQWMDSGQTAVLTQLERSPSNLAWSPDGTQIAFTMLVPEAEPSFDVEMPSAPRGAEWAGKPRVITRVKHEADGAGYMEPGFRHIFTVPADGGSPRQITSGDFQHGSRPAWLPDGSGLVFSANRIEDWPAIQVCDTCRLPLLTTCVRPSSPLAMTCSAPL